MKLLRIGSCLCVLFLGLQLGAQVPTPDFAVTNFSVWSTLPGPDGQRRMAISFRVTNVGSAVGPSMRTRVTVAGGASEFTIPELQPQASVFLSHTLLTTVPQVPITIEADAYHTVTEADEQNNTVTYTANPAGDAGRWQSIGPSRISVSPAATGQVRTIAVSPVSPFVVYAGGRDSGLWKTAGETTNWFPITDALPTQQIDAVAVDPRHADHVLIATPSGVFESNDGGSMWQQLTSQNLGGIGSDGGALLIANRPNPPLYISTLGGVKVSTDGGRTWLTVVGNSAQIESLQFSTTDATHLFASTSVVPGVFEAEDGGLTPTSWHQLQGCPDAPLPSFTPTASVWVTESQGTQWVSFRTKDPDGKRFELWRSTSETCSGNGFTEHGWQRLSLSGACNNYDNHWSYLFAHPNDPTVVFKGGIQLCRSSSSGNGMGTVSNIHVDHHAIAVAPSAPSVMFFGSDGGIYRSPDKGRTMNFLGEGMSNTEVLKIDVNGAQSPRIIIAGTQDNDAIGWDGVSPVWADLGLAQGIGDIPLIAFERKDRKGIYKMGQGTGDIQYDAASGDGFSTHGDIGDCPAYSEFPGEVVVGMESTGDKPQLLVTCHGLWSGPPWKQIKDPTQGDFMRLRLAPDNPQIAVAGTSAGHVFWGAALQPSLLFDVFTGAGEVAAIAMANQSLYYVAHNGTVTSTITRFQCFLGCTTETIRFGLGDQVTALGIDPLASDTVLAAVKGSGILRGTRDSAGQWTWTPYNNGIPIGANVTDIQARDDGSIAAAIYGRGVFLLRSAASSTGSNGTRGIVVELDEETDDSIPGHIRHLVTAELDSKPGFQFTGTDLPGTSLFALRTSFNSHVAVDIQSAPTGPHTARIVKAVLVGQ